MEKGVIAQQPRGKSRHSAAAWKKQRHSTAAWKEKILRSSVEKIDMAQHGGKSRYGTAAQKNKP